MSETCDVIRVIDPTDYIESINNTNTVFLEPVNRDEVSRIIKALNTSSPVVKNTSSLCRYSNTIYCKEYF